MLTFHTELFQTLVTQFKLSIEAERNLPLGKWRWDINSICHFLPALHLTFFLSLSCLSQALPMYRASGAVQMSQITQLFCAIRQSGKSVPFAVRFHMPCN